MTSDKAPEVRLRLIVEQRRAGACGDVPWGTDSIIAHDFEISRERVRQLRAELGFGTRRPRRLHDLRFCLECNKPLTYFNKTEYCPTGPCLEIELPCGWCGKLVRGSRARYLHRVTHYDGIYRSGRRFCNKQCAGKAKKGRPRDEWVD